MRQILLENGSKAWAFGYTQYVKADVSNVEECLSNKGETLPDRSPNPLLNTYRP